MSDSATLPIIEKIYQVYKPLCVINTKLEKAHRYSLGSETERATLEVLELLVTASFAPKPHKGPYLIKAQAKLEVLRLQLRLYLKLKLANETKLFQIQSDLQEAGRMLDG